MAKLGRARSPAAVPPFCRNCGKSCCGPAAATATLIYLEEWRAGRAGRAGRTDLPRGKLQPTVSKQTKLQYWVHSSCGDRGSTRSCLWLIFVSQFGPEWSYRKD